MAAGKNSKKRKVRGGARVDLRVVALILGLGGAAGATWFIWAGPALSEASSTGDQIASIEQSMTATQARIGQLRSGATSDAGVLLGQARALDAQLPAVVDKTTLVAEVPAAAAGFGLEVSRMDPQVSDAPAGTVGTLTFSMEVSGGQDQVMAFIEEVTSPANNIGLMTVDGLSLTVSGGKTSASFTLTAYHATSPTLPAGRSSEGGNATTTGEYDPSFSAPDPAVALPPQP